MKPPMFLCLDFCLCPWLSDLPSSSSLLSLSLCMCVYELYLYSRSFLDQNSPTSHQLCGEMLGEGNKQ